MKKMFLTYADYLTWTDDKVKTNYVRCFLSGKRLPCLHECYDRIFLIMIVILFLTITTIIISKDRTN